MNFAESKLTIRKPQLLDAVRANRAKHVDEYAEAYRAYREELVLELSALLEKARNQSVEGCDHGVEVDRPVSHASDYDRVIRMLEMDLADTVVLTESQFSQYVQDEWHWSGHNKAVMSSYGVSRAGRR